MKLILELTDEAVAALRDTLKVSTEDMSVVAVGSGVKGNARLEYAKRIVLARHILGMSVNFRDVCDDYVEKDDSDFCDVRVTNAA